jgi:hypothetical protein
MSDFETEIGTLEIFDDNSGDHQMEKGSFTVLEKKYLNEWIAINYPNGDYPKIINQGANRINNEVNFTIRYYSLNEQEIYEDCIPSIEKHLKKYGVI